MATPPEFAGLTRVEQLPDAVLAYLLPSEGRPGRRAHQFTANGFTLPFLQHHGFAAVKNPGEESIRYADMLAGLALTRPDDLLFLFSADPRPSWSVTSRRGIYGIYRVASSPFQDATSLSDPDTGYEILGECPGCQSQTFSFPRWAPTTRTWVAPPCATCGTPLPANVPTTLGPLYPSLVLPWRLRVEPLVLFPRPVTDERAYSDWEDPGTIWVGRHDNQSAGTGRGGKGSTIRQLTSEEAHKLTRLLLEENEPTDILVLPAPANYVGAETPLVNANGSPAVDPKVHRRPRAGDKIHGEFFISVALARQFDDPHSSFAAAAGIAPDVASLEYAAVFYPWGYTNATADFVMRFSKPDGRPYKIVVAELKEDLVSDGTSVNPGAIVQLAIYIPWIVSRLVHNAPALPSEVEVVPIVIGARLGVGAAAPRDYHDVLRTPRGDVNFVVRGTRFVEYSPADTYTDGDGHERAARIEFRHDPAASPQRIDWVARHARASSPEETNYVRATSWQQARTAAGLEAPV